MKPLQNSFNPLSANPTKWLNTLKQPKSIKKVWICNFQLKLNQFCALYLVLGLKNPDGIAYDWITGFLYWTDAQENTVNRLKNKIKEILVHEGLDEPRAIALNPCDSTLLVFLFICFSISWNRNERGKFF